MEYKDFEKLLKQEDKKQDEFTAKFNSFRGSIEEKLFLVGANCFSDIPLEFPSLDLFQDVLNEEETLSLIRFKNKILRNNQCLGYARDVISPLFPNPNSLDYAYFINLNRENTMFEFCQIYFLIFERLIEEKFFPKDSKCKQNSEITEAFGKLHDYRGALNHNTLDRGWICPKGTVVGDLTLTQQEAINELFAMLVLAKQRNNK